MGLVGIEGSSIGTIYESGTCRHRGTIYESGTMCHIGTSSRHGTMYHKMYHMATVSQFGYVSPPHKAIHVRLELMGYLTPHKVIHVRLTHTYTS